MKLTIEVRLKLNKKQLAIIEELSFHTTKLYNSANYICRESGYEPYETLEKQMKSNWHREYLHSHTYQQCLRTLDQNWTSYFKAIKDYHVNPQKYHGKPRPPKYKHMDNRKNEVIFTAFAIRRKGTQWQLSLAKKMQEKFQVKSLNVEVSEKLPLPEHAKIQQVRIRYDRVKKAWGLLIIYRIAVREPRKAPHLLSIDLGLDNLATVTVSNGTEAYIVCGRTLKSKNSYYHQQIARLQSIRMKQTGSERFKTTRRIRHLHRKRANYIHNFLHQASRHILNLAHKHRAGTIVIGDLKGIKQGSHLKTFVQIPIRRLVDMIKYKAELDGRTVVLQNEKYTSGVSAYDLEPINQAHYRKERRFTRGCFRTETGLVVNADVNGSLNIMRKRMKGIPYPIQLVRDNGCVNHPRRIRVA